MALWSSCSTDWCIHCTRDHCKNLCAGALVIRARSSSKSINNKRLTRKWRGSVVAKLALHLLRWEHQGRYELCPTCWQLPPACTIALSLMQTKLWPASSSTFLSLTHTLGKAFDSSEPVKWGRDRGSPLSLTRPPPRCTDTAREMEAGQICPPIEALGPFWRVSTAHCKHPPQRQPSKKGLRCPVWGLGVT